MKRPILMIAIGYIIGIIEGLYFKKSIVFFYLFIAIIYIILKIISKYYHKKIWKITRYKRYIKLYINKKAIILMLITSIFGNILIIKEERKFMENTNIINKDEIISITGTIESGVTKKLNDEIYKVKIIDIETKNSTNRNIVLKNVNIYAHKNTKNTTNSKEENIKYGDIVKIRGKFIEPKSQRNYKGFDKKLQYKTKNITGDIKAQKIAKIKDFDKTKFSLIKIYKTIKRKSIEASEKIKNKITQILPRTTSSILIGILLGDKSRNRRRNNRKF